MSTQSLRVSIVSFVLILILLILEWITEASYAAYASSVKPPVVPGAGVVPALSALVTTPTPAQGASSPPFQIFLPFVKMQGTCGTPVIIGPADASLLAKTTFDWTDVPGASSYTFQIAPTSSFNSSVVNQNVINSQYTYTSTLTGLYYWRVAATVGSGNCLFASRSIRLVDYNGDDDGDSLPNGWELQGYDADGDGIVDVNLPALGANYRHKDIFVQMDYMYRATAAYGLAPNQTVLDGIVATFNSAPISNPDGVTGIKIHLELTNQVPYDDDLNPPYNDFIALKNVYFNPKRTAVYHYMIWANKYNGGTSSGYSFGIPYTDFIVTLGGWNSGAGGTDYQKIGTFIHELGHNLGLTHGGNDHVNYKPNYLSVMNYRFQTWGVYRNDSWYNFDYQRFALPALNETSLNEPVGLNSGGVATGYGTTFACPSGTLYLWNADGAIDWNCNGYAEIGVTADVNWDGGSAHSYTVLGSQDNWANIVFNGGGIIGSGLAPAELARRVQSLQVDPQLDELNFEQQQKFELQMRNLRPR